MDDKVKQTTPYFSFGRKTFEKLSEFNIVTGFLNCVMLKMTFEGFRF